MKLAIIGMNPYYESDRVLYEALKMGHEAVFLSKRRIIETNFFNSGEFGIYFSIPNKSEQIKFSEDFPDLSPLELNIPKEFNPTIEKKTLLGGKKNNLCTHSVRH